jgi:hypothetical protein
METLIGKRCRVTAWVHDRRSGMQLHERTGTIRWQTNNFDRMLLLVAWDEEIEPSYVFPTDIEVLQETSVQGTIGPLDGSEEE